MKQVIVIRKDLGMRKGKMIAQGAHASMAILTQCIRGNVFSPSYEIEKWLDGPFVKIVVGCNSEEELKELEMNAIRLGIHTALIQDVGRTEFHNVPTYTALAIGPDKEEIMNKVTGHLKLL